MKTPLLVLFFIFTITLMHGQCYMDQHNTNWNDGWTSCKTALSPNPVRGESHWVLYSLGYKYALGTSHWWNQNEADALANGVRSMAIDVSLDGAHWTEWKVFELPMASGLPQYEGFDGPDLEKIQARYILLTALDNYGGSCVGFSEMKISVEVLSEVTDQENSPDCLQFTAFPNPFSSSLHLSVASECVGDVSFVLEDALGHRLINTVSLNGTTKEHSLATQYLSPGIYFIRATNGTTTTTQKVIKVE